MSDRLDAIKRRALPESGSDLSDVTWLVAEVERLKEEAVRLRGPYPWERLEKAEVEVERLRTEAEEDQRVVQVWRRRTDEAEAETERLRAEIERMDEAICDFYANAVKRQTAMRTRAEKAESIVQQMRDLAAQWAVDCDEYPGWTSSAAIRLCRRELLAVLDGDK